VIPVARSRPFALHRRTVRRPVELAFVHEGAGGVPLVLLHGWPETNRIWWRNVEPLAAAGFEVIAPDLRGFGASRRRPATASTTSPRARATSRRSYARSATAAASSPAATSAARSRRTSATAAPNSSTGSSSSTR